MNMFLSGQAHMLWYSRHRQTHEHLPLLMSSEAYVFSLLINFCPLIGMYFLPYSSKDHLANVASLFICFLLAFETSTPFLLSYSPPCQTPFPCSWEDGAI